MKYLVFQVQFFFFCKLNKSNRAVTILVFRKLNINYNKKNDKQTNVMIKHFVKYTDKDKLN